MARRKKDGPEVDEQVEAPVDSVEDSGVSVGASDLFQLVANHQKKSDLVCYLYRTWPVIDRRLSGAKAKYIDKLTAEMTTVDYIRKAWGSGRYRLDLFDAGVGKYGTRIASTKLDLGYDMDCMPVIGPGFAELVRGHPDNKSFEQTLRMRGLLTEEEVDDMKDSGAAAVAQLSNTVTELAGKLSERRQAAGDEPLSLALSLIDRLQAGRPDPIEQAAKLKELLGGDNKLLAIFLENQARLTEMMLKNQAPAAVSVLDQLDTLTQVMEKLGNLAGRRHGGGGGAGWIDQLVRAIPSVVGSVAQALTAAVALKAAPAGVPAPMLPQNAAATAANPEQPPRPLIDSETD